jgi:hypothetical protein
LFIKNSEILEIGCGACPAAMCRGVDFPLWRFRHVAT